jgi:ribose-phosphate pyrophosphokinase
VGDVRGLAPIIVDDMISTGGTIVAAVQALLTAGCVPQLTVVTSHALLVGPAIERLRLLPVQRFVATDSVPIPTGIPFSLHVASLDALLAEAIRRLHGHLSLRDLIVHE